MQNDTSKFSPLDLSNIFSPVSTARLLLRRPRLEDAPAMFAIHGDPATNLYNPYGPDPDLAASTEELRDWLQHWQEYGFGYWTITPLQEEHIIGFGGIRHLLWRERDILNLYYRFTPTVWRQGFASEMTQVAISLARTYLPQWPVVARTRTANVPSIRTALRSGLIRRPDLDTEHVVFALGWEPLA